MILIIKSFYVIIVGMNTLDTVGVSKRDSVSSFGPEGVRLFQVVNDPCILNARKEVGRIPELVFAGAPPADFYEYLTSSCDREKLEAVHQKFLKEHNFTLYHIRSQQVLMVVWFSISLLSTLGLLVTPFGLPLFTIGIISLVVLNGLFSTLSDENGYKENGKIQWIKLCKSFYKHTFSPGALAQKKNYQMERFLGTKEGLHLFPDSFVAKKYFKKNDSFYHGKANFLIKKLEKNESIFSNKIEILNRKIDLYKGKRYRFGPFLQEILLKAWTCLYIASLVYPPLSLIPLLIRWVIFSYIVLSVFFCLHDITREKMTFKEMVFRSIDVCFCPSTFKEWLKEEKEDLNTTQKELEKRREEITAPFSVEKRQQIYKLLERAKGCSSIDRQP